MMYLAFQTTVSTWWDTLLKSAPVWIFAVGAAMKWIVSPALTAYMRKDLSSELATLGMLRDTLLVVKPTVDRHEEILKELPDQLNRIETMLLQQRGQHNR